MTLTRRAMAVAAVNCGAAGMLSMITGCSSQLARPRTTGTTYTSTATDSERTAPPVSSAALLRLAPQYRETLLARTMLVVNTPYTFGGNTPEGGFDCSGLIQWAVQGIRQTARLPRTTAQWAQASQPLPQRHLQRGDFLFFNTSGKRYSHMGIFVGNGQFVHAPSSGGTVQRVRMDNPYFVKRFTEVRSIFA